jgi:hypothetical protein
MPLLRWLVRRDVAGEGGGKGSLTGETRLVWEGRTRKVVAWLLRKRREEKGEEGRRVEG